MLNRRIFLLSATSVAVATAASAHSYKLGSLEISHPWTRATAATAPTAGGFLKITNTGTTPDRLVSATSTASSKAEIHEMKMDGNVMRMRELDKGLEIPAGATVELKPGGYHLMLIGLKEPLKEGAKMPLTLVFEKAGKIDVELSVMAIGAMPKSH